MSAAARLCPGFQPHAVKPTRCKRCFRDLVEHRENDPPKKAELSPLRKPDKPDNATNSAPKAEFTSTTSSDGKSVASVSSRSGTEESPTTSSGSTRRRRPVAEAIEEDNSESSALTRKNSRRVRILAAQQVSETGSNGPTADVEFILTVKTEKPELNSSRNDLSKQASGTTSYSNQDKSTSSSKNISGVEQNYQELLEENATLKSEVRELESQLEELQDNFREDPHTDFHDLKRELEAANKNCRVLQFKLRKAEKRVEQVECENAFLAAKVTELEHSKQIVDKSRSRDVDEELRISKTLYQKLTVEMEQLKAAKRHLENKLTSTDILSESQPSKAALKSAAMGKDYDTLCRDLFDSMERETDLREQLRFSEEETKTLRKKLNQLERDNEALVLQIQKMAGTRERKASVAGESEDESAEVLRLQLSLQDQELSVLRRKAEELEQKNESLEREVKYVQDKLISQPLARVELPSPPSNENDVDVYHKQKAKLLEYEAKELRQKLIEKERENERLQSEIQVLRRKAAKVMVRSRSLDSDLQVDLKRQLQLIEQEAQILRQKTQDLENENDKLVAENKRYQLRVSRRPPPGPLELLQLDNMELKQKLAEAETKFNVLKENYENVAMGASPTAVIQDYRPSKESELSHGEADLIASLKKRIRVKEEQTNQMEAKIAQQDVELTKVTREYKKLAESVNYKRKAPRLVRETATRGELKEIIGDLEDEISELQIAYRGKEVLLENVQNDLEKLKQDPKVSSNEQFNRLKQERDQLQQRVQELQQSLQSKTASEQKKGSETQEKTINQLNESLQATTKLLEQKTKQLATTEEELAKCKKELQSYESKLQLMSSKLKSTESALESLKKENAKSQMSKISNGKGPLDGDQTETLKQQLSQIQLEVKNLRSENALFEKTMIDKENQLKREAEREKEKAVRETKEQFQQQLQTLKEQENSLKEKISTYTATVEKKEQEIKSIMERLRTANQTQRKEKEEKDARIQELEEHSRQELKRRERALRECQLDVKNKTQEILDSQNKVVQLERENRRLTAKIQDMVDEHSKDIKELEKEIEKEQREYEDLTSRYELLEEEFLALKNKLTLEKQQVESALKQLRRDYERTQMELTAVRESQQNRLDSSTREKLELQNIIRELEAKLTRYKDSDAERGRLKVILQERENFISELKNSEKNLRSENDSLRKKNDNLEKRYAELERKQRQYAQNEASSVKQQANLRGEMDSRISFMANEVDSQQNQIINLAKERDSLADKLASTTEELHRIRASVERTSGREAIDLAQKKMDDLRYQISDLRNQLEDSLSDNRKLRIQLEADKNTWEIQMANLKTKINQYEERNLLEASRGSTKQYVKTRLELAWDKERQDQQKVLSDAQEALRSLREKLLRIENERETEREQKQLQQSKSQPRHDDPSSDRIYRIQGSIVELERDMKNLRELLMTDNLLSKAADAQQRPLRMGAPQSQLEATLQKVLDDVDLLRRCSAPLRDDEMIKRAPSFRRALSAHDMGPNPVIRPPPRQKSINRKAMSLGYGLSNPDMKIWESGESLNMSPAGSLSSLGRGYDSDASIVSAPARHWGKARTVDSDAASSAASSMENVTPTKHKKSLKDRLRSLGLTKSTANLSSTPQPEEKSGSTSSLKSRISKAFGSKSQSGALSPVLERKKKKSKVEPTPRPTLCKQGSFTETLV